MRTGLIALVLGYLCGWLLIPQKNYTLSYPFNAGANPLWTAPVPLRLVSQERRSLLHRQTSLEGYDRALAWDSYDIALKIMDVRLNASTSKAGLVRQHLSDGYYSTWAKVTCLRSLQCFYQNPTPPASVDPGLYAARRANVLRLRELMVVDGGSSDWKKNARDGARVDWTDMVNVSYEHEASIAGHHLMMVLKRNWHDEDLSMPLQSTPYRHQLLSRIVNLATVSQDALLAEELRDYRLYYPGKAPDADWDELLARLSKTHDRKSK
jgi:hypothetical protein